jgi:phosphatidylserine/phosphatidylglycerophosphate/cardiolipin synthase-like enzyme
MDAAAKSDLLDRIARFAIRLPTSRIDSFCNALESGESSNAVKTFPNADSRIEAQQIVDAWQAAGSNDLMQLAWALRAAAAIDDVWRESQKLELVWTGPSNSGETFRRTDQALLELIDSAKKELWIVSFVAYKIEPINKALKIAIDRGVIVSLVLESKQESGGKISFDGIQSLERSVRQKSRIYVWPEDKRPESDDGNKGALHAKCAVADTSKLLVSSANLTDAAMQLNIEMGILVSGGKLPRQVAANLAKMVHDETIVRV